MMRFFILLAVSAMIAGCTTVEDPFLTSSISMPSAPPVASEVSPDYALAILPGFAGGIRSVRQQVQDKSATQEIVLENATAAAGENVLTVEVGLAGSTTSLSKAPTQAQIQSDLRRHFPTVTMEISPVIGENVHGVYGYATGPFAASGSCLYAWQITRNISNGAVTSYLDSLANNTYSASVRLHYCSAALGPDRIAALMQGLRIKPITDGTFQVLNFGVGSAAAQQASPVAALVATQPLLERAVTRAKPKNRMTETRIPAGIKNAVAVPLPGETTPSTSPTKVVTDVEIKRKAVAVPLPDAQSL